MSWVTQRQPQKEYIKLSSQAGRQRGRGVGECWDCRLTPGHHKHPHWSCFNSALSGGSTAVMQHPKSQLQAGSCWQVLTPWAAAGEEMPALTSVGACRAKHLACPSRGSGTLASPPWAHRKCILRRKRLCWNSLQPFAKQREARGSLPGLSTFATAHEVKFGLPKQTVKQMGCYVHLLYLWLCIIMITGWLPWTVQAVKGGQLCFYNIVSHKANTEIPNCLIFYLKKLYRHKAEECWKRKSRKEVCINKEVFLTSKMSRESQSLQKLG